MTRCSAFGWFTIAILIGTSLGAYPALADEHVTYAYDALGRIVSATYTNGKTINYTYDAAGNRAQVIISG